ncbi:hydantoinase/oxoprolinase family protein [Micrococcales bacterium 31B]|nr:hydantoinase/oxoprolinase family protein [Micrococcales bacterium 31B]
MRIGIDVGGTNTDAVLLDGRTVLATVKTATTADVTSGIEAAVRALREQSRVAAERVQAVMIGTTHFINALIERKHLARTACVRLGAPASAALPPFTAWPADLVEAIGGVGYLAHGGHEFNGEPISALDEKELRDIAAQIAASGARSVAISSVFSPINTEFEVRAAEVLRDALGPDTHLSLSHEVGRIGLLERENATIINAALRDLAGRIVDALTESLLGSGIAAPIYLSQNDGTLMDVAHARNYPVATFASGPTNSMRGAMVLTGFDTCAVIDVGGTTADIGIVSGGFPRLAGTEVSVAGVRTNFRMPDVLSLGIGGGSLISPDAPGHLVGPESVGFRLVESARVFGGDTLTATDLAVAAGRVTLGDPNRVADLDLNLVERALTEISERIAATVDAMRTSADELPIVAVGGGSVLLPDDLPGLGRVHRVEHHAVANAIGAAIAQVSGEVDRVYAVTETSRAEVVEQARAEAIDRAIAAGAEPASVEIVEVDEVPIPYLPGNATRVRAKAVGDLALTGASETVRPSPEGAQA